MSIQKYRLAKIDGGVTGNGEWANTKISYQKMSSYNSIKLHSINRWYINPTHNKKERR